MPTIISQIEQLEDNLRRFRYRFDTVEKSLRSGSLSVKRRDDLLNEEENLTKLIAESEKDVKLLRAENRKTMLVSVILLAVLAGLYYSFAGFS
ncbi:coiled-coil domain-containing protein 167-like [Saccoglossus kowalevskii]|uniref:Coiled-coil domain-containing protein 167 n=1 Tax=Saccoglossus kowalevskii TaxID=10224 RepID=A0ABM0H0F4_SACKO|nr:PREDICTED: coiled-coil domain-containing protein 167-like [Saccoglossus kowalevskii]